MPENSHLPCSAPPSLTDDDLFSVLDEEADPGVMEHLAQCESCSERLAVFRAFEQAFKHTLYRFDCPSPLELVEYQSGDMLMSAVNEITANEITQHLERCPRCHAELANLNAFDQEAATVSAPLPIPRSALHQRRRSNPNARYPQPPLQFQPPSYLAGAALRGEEALTLDVSVDDLLITLNLKKAPGTAALSGVLMAADPAQEIPWHGALVQCALKESLIGQTLLDPTLSFDFALVGDEPIPISLYIIATDGTTLALEDMIV